MYLKLRMAFLYLSFSNLQWKLEDYILNAKDMLRLKYQRLSLDITIHDTLWEDNALCELLQKIKRAQSFYLLQHNVKHI